MQPPFLRGRYSLDITTTNNNDNNNNMRLYLLTWALGIAVVSADAAAFVADANSVAAQASLLASQVNAYNTRAGLAGALAIQFNFDTLSKAVASFESDSGSITPADITKNVTLLQNMLAALQNLLNGLTSRANDFNSIGVSSIVSGDIDNLNGPAEAIVSKLVSVGTSQCSAISALKGPVSSFSTAFLSASSAYHAKSSFTLVPITCTH